MYKRNANNTQNIRLLSADEGAAYMGIGKTAFRAYAVKIGAVRRFGKRVLFDKHVLDWAIDSGFPEISKAEMDELERQYNESMSWGGYEDKTESSITTETTSSADSEVTNNSSMDATVSLAAVK